MSNDSFRECAPVVVSFLAVVCAFIGGCRTGVTHMKHEAVKQGVAEYSATPRGSVEFKWRTTK